MGIKQAFYKSQLKRLFPVGKMWGFTPGSIFDKLIDAVALELERIDARASELIIESDPRTTAELIDEWETLMGLPGMCGVNAETLQDRRNQIVAKLTLRGNQSKQFFVDIGLRLGYDLTVNDIIEYQPFRVGFSRVGERLTNTAGWIHAFTINVEEFTVRPFRVGQNSAGDRLVAVGDELLECLMEENKPAHTVLTFTYG